MSLLRWWCCIWCLFKWWLIQILRLLSKSLRLLWICFYYFWGASKSVRGHYLLIFDGPAVETWYGVVCFCCIGEIKSMFYLVWAINKFWWWWCHVGILIGHHQCNKNMLHFWGGQILKILGRGMSICETIGNPNPCL